MGNNQLSLEGILISRAQRRQLCSFKNDGIPSLRPKKLWVNRIALHFSSGTPLAQLSKPNTPQGLPATTTAHLFFTPSGCILSRAHGKGCLRPASPMHIASFTRRLGAAEEIHATETGFTSAFGVQQSKAIARDHPPLFAHGGCGSSRIEGVALARRRLWNLWLRYILWIEYLDEHDASSSFSIDIFLKRKNRPLNCMRVPLSVYLQRTFQRPISIYLTDFDAIRYLGR
ncbi:hypothetical protein CC78DRAFT_534418 [Lojkania enalia]|uniref:Uncharacterized protein n=1 Tax=Lojkania enalia TaxID=147567 RepID=A0A9P4N1Y4_9PLEO|nr:hypothetical protein CC78DRAFT_534418 [Didymosphaeria enalia]